MSQLCGQVNWKSRCIEAFTFQFLLFFFQNVRLLMENDIQSSCECYWKKAVITNI